MPSFKVKKCKKCKQRPVVEIDEDGNCLIYCESCGREADGPTILSAVQCWEECANAD
jgi:hypothetical protein